MRHDTAVFLVSDEVKAVTVSYEPDGKEYTVKSLIPDLQKDDYVIMPTDTRHGYTVVRVVDPDVEIDLEGSYGAGLKWLAGKFDPSDYVATLANEEKMIQTIRNAEKQRKRRELKRDLDDLTGGKLDDIQLLSHSADTGAESDGTDPSDPNA